MLRDSLNIFRSIHVVYFRSILQIYVDDSVNRIYKDRDCVKNLYLYGCLSKYCIFILQQGLCVAVPITDLTLFVYKKICKYL